MRFRGLGAVDEQSLVPLNTLRETHSIPAAK